MYGFLSESFVVLLFRFNMWNYIQLINAMLLNENTLTKKVYEGLKIKFYMYGIIWCHNTSVINNQTFHKFYTFNFMERFEIEIFSILFEITFIILS